MSHPRRRLVTLAALVTLAPLAAVVAPPAGPAAAGPARADEPAATARIWAPAHTHATLYGRRQLASVSLPVRLVAGSAPIEVWAHRASYDEPITATLRVGGEEVALPAGVMTTFGGLDDVLGVKVVDVRTGEVVMTRKRDVCLNGYGQRVRPDAAARSPYPTSCYANPYGLGSVQGVQAGWSNPVLDPYGRGGLRLPLGRYDVTITVKRRFADLLSMTPTDATRTMRVKVGREEEPDHGHGEPEGRQADSPASPAPDAQGPAGRRLDEVEGPRPDLRSLPVWNISISARGNYLRFNATVWNAGNSPLVVDGFVADTEDRMDAYQYFFDGDGEQTGYQQVGSFEFDHKETHQHWHFRDFATYTLLRADQTTAVKSRKEAFCLANTDAVDLTVPDADWTPENTDLSTDCGFEDSLSLRQVLAAGWGDTYAQFRAGQSFDLRGLPNGTYYIATIANPRGRLVESDTDNNVALREVVIGGKAGARTVTVPQVGVVVEPDSGGGGR